jgi:hypothetical protein
MPFEETDTLQNDDSKVKIDVETLARIEFSDVEYLLSEIDKGNIDSRLEKILYESIISKMASVFQLAMRAYEYLENTDLKKELINAFNKSQNRSTGKIGKYREDLFHSGIHFFEKTIFYPFGKIEGRGFKGLHIKKGARLNISGVWDFNSDDNEYAITSEGVFEILNPETSEEKWNKIDEFPTVSAIDFNNIREVIDNSIVELKLVWSKIKEILKAGDGTHQYSFLNENGKWELIVEKNGGHTIYKAESKKLEITGDLTINPPEKIIIKDNSIHFE